MLFHFSSPSSPPPDTQGACTLLLHAPSKGLCRPDPPFTLPPPTQCACTLLLYAPSEGLCRQYMQLIKSGFAVLSAAATTSLCRHQASNSGQRPPEASRGDEGAEGEANPHTPPAAASTPHAERGPAAAARVWTVIPGGAALDAALAVRLDLALEQATGRAVRLDQALDQAAGRAVPQCGGCSSIAGEDTRPSASDAADPTQLVLSDGGGEGGSCSWPSEHPLLPPPPRDPLAGGTSGVLLAELLLRRPPSLLLPALRVLRAMAAAVPSALARTGIASSASGATSSAAAAAGHPVRRGTFSQVGGGLPPVGLWDSILD